MFLLSHDKYEFNQSQVNEQCFIDLREYITCQNSEDLTFNKCIYNLNFMFFFSLSLLNLIFVKYFYLYFKFKK